jgi:tetratricopeptide (TPR) repeat protein
MVRRGRLIAAGVAALCLIGLTACGSADYLVPPGGGPTASGYQQAAELHWTDVTESLQRAAYDEEQAIADDPAWPVPHARLAQIFLALNEPESAIAEAERAVALAPGSALYWNNLGQLALSLGRTTLAEHAYREALKRHPGDWQAADGLAALALRQQRWSDAVRWLRLALVWGGPQGLTYDLFGRYYWLSGNDAAAEAYFTDAASADPAWWQPDYDLALVELRLGETEAAYASLGQALSLSPGQGVVWHLYRKVGQMLARPGGS